VLQPEEQPARPRIKRAHGQGKQQGPQVRSVRHLHQPSAVGGGAHTEFDSSVTHPQGVIEVVNVRQRGHMVAIMFHPRLLVTVKQPRWPVGERLVHHALMRHVSNRVGGACLEIVRPGNGAHRFLRCALLRPIDTYLQGEPRQHRTNGSVVRVNQTVVPPAEKKVRNIGVFWFLRCNVQRPQPREQLGQVPPLAHRGVTQHLQNHRIGYALAQGDVVQVPHAVHATHPHAVAKFDPGVQPMLLLRVQRPAHQPVAHQGSKRFLRTRQSDHRIATVRKTGPVEVKGIRHALRQMLPASGAGEC